MPKAAIKPEHKFKVGDQLQLRTQNATIDYIDYTRNVYIFDKIINHHWTRWERMSFDIADKIFIKIN